MGTRVLLFLVLLGIVTGCGPSEEQIRRIASEQAIAALTAVPTPTPYLTPTPEPTATPQPTATPVDVQGIADQRIALALTAVPTPTPYPTATPQPTPTRVPTATPQPTPTPVPPLSQIYTKVRFSVARIETPTGRGTGWAIGNDLLITDYHVVVGATGEINVYLPSAGGEASYKATVVGWDKLLDIAVLKIPEAALTPLITRRIYSDEVPEQVLALGWAFGVIGYPGVKLGVITTVGRMTKLNNLGFFESDAAFDPGDSGGPVVDLQGRVVGIIQAQTLATSSGQRVIGQQKGLTVDSIDAVVSDLIAGKQLNSSSPYWWQNL